MKRWVFLWSLILGTLATRLSIARLLDLPALRDMSSLSVDAFIIAACLAIAGLFLALRLSRERRHRPASPAAPAIATPAPDPVPDVRLDELRLQLAKREEQLSFVRELLETRTAELARLQEERAAISSRLHEVQAAADRWRDEHDRVAAEMEAERTRFAREEARLSGDVMRITLETSHRADELIHAMRELLRRTNEVELLRAEAVGLRAELERVRAVPPASPAPARLDNATRDDVPARPRAGSLADL